MLRTEVGGYIDSRGCCWTCQRKNLSIVDFSSAQPMCGFYGDLRSSVRGATETSRNDNAQPGKAGRSGSVFFIRPQNRANALVRAET